MVRGLISGREYSEEDIFDPTIYPRMKEEPLLDDDDCIVVPVRNEKAPHYRRVGSPSFGRMIGRAENNPTHDYCVALILKELENSKTENIKFSTNRFSKDGTFEEQVIFSPLKGSDYKWYMEKDSRIAFSEGTYIQPDISGRDANKFFPRAAYPNIIIEVVRTHFPELETFRKLFELSKTNHHIYFYFIGKDKKSSKFNSFSMVDGNFKFRVSHYLIGGELYKNGTLYAPMSEGETFEHWYQFLGNTYFTSAKEQA